MTDCPRQFKAEMFSAVTQDSSSFRLFSNSNSTKMTELPLDYKPSAYCVMCGRGSSCFNSIGNRRFRVIASMCMAQYSKANTKLAKTKIVTQILDIIESSGGGFVKYENGKYYEVSEAIAREKVGAHLRDCLHGCYKSAAKSKLARRKARTAALSEEESNSSSSSRVDDNLSITADTDSWNDKVEEEEEVSRDMFP